MLLRVVVLFCVCCTTALADNITISLKPEVSVKTPTYALGDIATVSGLAAVKQKLLRLNVGISARPGYFVDVPVSMLKIIVQRDLPELAKKIAWQGEKTSRVRAIGRPVDVSKIEAKASQALKQWLDEHYAVHSQKLIGDIKSVEVPFGNIRFNTYMHKANKAHKRMAVAVDILVNEKIFHTLRLWYEVSAEQMVYQVASDIAPNTEVLDSLFYKAFVDVTTFNGTPIAVDELSANQRTTKALAVDQVLTADAIELMPMVSKGEFVDVSVITGGINIVTKAIALKSGNFNEHIPVLNPKTKASYDAVVLGAGKVRVE